MKFSCDQCNAQYMIADEKVGSKGVKVRCKKCSHVIIVRPSADAGAPQAAHGGEAHAGATAGGASGSGQPAMGGWDAAGQPAAGAWGAAGQPAGGNGAASAFGQASGDTGWAASGQPTPASGDAGAGAASGSSDWSFDAAFSAAASPPQAAPPAASGRPPGEKEWYVAIDESQVGPVDIADIEQRWDTGEIDEDSLAWKAGMQDWSSIAEIPELAYLIAERPQQRAGASSQLAGPGFGAGLAAASSAGGASRASSQLGPVAFAGSGSGESSEWKPSAARALGSLIEEEIEAANKPAAPAQPSPSDIGMPDLFGPGRGAASAMPAGATSFGPPPGDFASAASWTAPKPQASSSKGLLIALISVLSVLVVGGGLFAGWYLFLRPATLRGGGAAGPPKIADASLTANHGGSEAGHQQANVSPVAKGGQQAAAANSGGTASSAPAPKPAAPKPAPKPHVSKPAKPAPKAAASKPEPRAHVAARPTPPPRTTKVLGAREVGAVAKSNARNTVGCIKAARSSGELLPGRHVLVLGWDIQPDGSVTNGRLTGPPEVLGTSLPACFAAKMRQWKFPASVKEVPVRNFPLPFTLR